MLIATKVFTFLLFSLPIDTSDNYHNAINATLEEKTKLEEGETFNESVLLNLGEDAFGILMGKDQQEDNCCDKLIFKRDVDFINQSFENDSLNANFSKEDYLDDIRQFIFPKSWTWVLIFFHFVVFVIGLVGNTLVCVAVYRNHTMRTVTNYFIVNLAIADFLVILFCLPPSVVWDVTMTWFFGLAMCKIVLYLQSVSVTVSVLTLTFISIDRWYAICFPLKFKSTTGRAKTAIGIIWLFALVFDIPEAVHSETYPHPEIEVETIYFTQCQVSWSEDTERMFVLIKLILLYALPLIFMTIAYVQIIRVLWRSGNVAHQTFGDVGGGGRHANTFAMNMNTSTEGQLRSRRKAAKMLVAVVVMFAFCYFPVHLLSVLRLTAKLKNTEFNRAYALISHWLCYANSAVNPIIYNFMSGKFRKAFCRAFEECCKTGGGGVVRGYQLSVANAIQNENDSGVITSSQGSRRNCVVGTRRLNLNNTAAAAAAAATNDVFFEPKHSRQGTKTSVLRMDV